MVMSQEIWAGNGVQLACPVGLEQGQPEGAPPFGIFLLPFLALANGPLELIPSGALGFL